MKVLQINSVCGTGSTGRIATDIHDLLLEQEYESYIAYGRGIAKNCDTAIRIGTDMDVYAHGALTRVFDRHGFGSKRATKKFIDQVKAIDPDIIHLHNIHGYYINIEMLFEYIKQEDKPVVWTLHDCWAFTGHCPYFDYVGCDRWKKGCHNCPQKLSLYKSWVFDNSKSNYRRKKELFTGVKDMTIVTPSEWLSGLVKQSFLSEYTTKIINNGIDTEVFKPTESSFREKYNLQDKFIILGVANVWEGRKGLKFLVRLSRKLKADETLVIVGLNKKQLREMPDNIIAIARTESIKELAEIYTAADVFVNTTLEEVLGLTNLEAMACGTPVVMFKTGGSVECIDDNTGVIVPKGDFNALRKAVSDIKRTGKAHYSDNCIRRTGKIFDKKNQNLKYVEIYKVYG